MIFYSIANNILSLTTGLTTSMNGSGDCYLGLCTAEPTPDGKSLNEISRVDYPSYERILLNAYSAKDIVNIWGTPDKGTVTNIKPVAGNSQCEEVDGWPKCTHWVLFSAKTDGIPMVADVFRDPDGSPDPTTGLYPETTLTVEYKKVPVFRTGALQLTLK